MHALESNELRFAQFIRLAGRCIVVLETLTNYYVSESVHNNIMKKASQRVLGEDLEAKVVFLRRERIEACVIIE